MLNMRNDPWVTLNNCRCRAVVVSHDGGETWSDIAYDATLVDPVCEGAIAQIGHTYTLFSNPAMVSARANLTVRVSADGGQTWPSSVRLGDSAALGDYSSIVQGKLIRGGTINPANLAVGVIWGSCTIPWPFRPWCMLGRAWNVYFTRFELPDV